MRLLNHLYDYNMGFGEWARFPDIHPSISSFQVLLIRWCTWCGDRGQDPLHKFVKESDIYLHIY